PPLPASTASLEAGRWQSAGVESRLEGDRPPRAPGRWYESIRAAGGHHAGVQWLPVRGRGPAPPPLSLAPEAAVSPAGRPDSVAIRRAHATWTARSALPTLVAW